jgi:hypothetical protein
MQIKVCSSHGQRVWGGDTTWKIIFARVNIVKKNSTKAADQFQSNLEQIMN